MMYDIDIYSERAQNTLFPTPDDIAEKLLVGIDWRFIESILEPSAGKGNLAKYCAGRRYKETHFYYPRDDHDWNNAIDHADIDCIEIDGRLRDELSANGFRVIHDDFLTFQTQKRYNLIAMNPPFDQGAKHLLKAIDVMRRGGEIRCILNAETIRNPYSIERQELIEKLKLYGATIQYIENGFSSADRKTDVSIALIRITIPMAKLDSTIMDDMRKAPTYHKQEVPECVSTLAQYDAIDQFVNRYNFEVACGIRLIEEYQALTEYAINDEDKYSGAIITMGVHAYCEKNCDANINAYIREVRGKYWRAIFQQPVFTGKLTSNLQNELHDNVVKLKDYEFSAYNILTLIEKMNGRVVKGVEDTIIALFDSWTALNWSKESPNRHYYNGWCTNDCFRIGKKVIIPFYSCDSWENKFRAFNVLSKFRYIEKVFDFLDNGRTNWEGSLDAAFRYAEATENARNIDTKYFTATFYKKGTAHLVFKDENLLEKFNLFASMRKGWLPPSYGKKHYRDMIETERAVIDDFQGKDKYEEVLSKSDYYLNGGSEMLMICGA